MDDNTKILELLTEFVEKVDSLTKKVDKMTSLNTKIAKSLHLIPVTEREERELQLLQRKNLQLAAKVNAELTDMQPPAETMSQLSMETLKVDSIFADVLGSDYLPKE